LGKHGAWFAISVSQKQDVFPVHPQSGTQVQFPALRSIDWKVFASSFDDVGEAIARVASVPRIIVVKRIITLENELDRVVLIR